MVGGGHAEGIVGIAVGHGFRLLQLTLHAERGLLQTVGQEPECLALSGVGGAHGERNALLGVYAEAYHVIKVVESKNHTYAIFLALRVDNGGTGCPLEGRQIAHRLAHLADEEAVGGGYQRTARIEGLKGEY